MKISKNISLEIEISPCYETRHFERFSNSPKEDGNLLESLLFIEQTKRCCDRYFYWKIQWLTFESLHSSIQRGMMQNDAIDEHDSITRHYPAVHLSDASRHQASNHNDCIRHIKWILIIQDTKP